MDAEAIPSKEARVTYTRIGPNIRLKYGMRCQIASIIPFANPREVTINLAYNAFLTKK